ncbi:DEAD/DEAH box helicase [Geminocystis sp. NIES-3709]|uniref:DEAD/DEAH box helicase n=1 Tax=Geminocystis sp. NIES-3709 TaxID=1617448 RepID=UPI0005FCA831|nr:DEAD/DEAH box helicase [Geminocystis sp. NIES-3709]BAQ66505.1 superfamily I DNA and RNA helicases [Geminocystis sp. NIES-3709]
MNDRSNLYQIRELPSDTAHNTPVRVICYLQSQLTELDAQQKEIAHKYYDGAQRIRGLAGAGKTITFAQRSAQIHYDHPEWKIAFIFFTRSLYQQVIQERISQYYHQLSPEKKPNWENLKVFHAWGAKDKEGFYRHLCLFYQSRCQVTCQKCHFPLRQCQFSSQSVDNVKEKLGKNISPGKGFQYVCDDLEKKITEFVELYDVILIDEGQDLPPSFYRLARNSLHEPKRLYWAYDEAQSIGSLIVPQPSTIFGKNPDGSLVVDLRGRAENWNKSYRTPSLLLTIAHAVNMGLLRKKGVLQGVSNQKQWENLGYEVVEGDFSQNSVKEGKLVKITRKPENNPHPVDNVNFPHREALGEILTIKILNNEVEEKIWIAQQIKQDLQQGLQPHDILITALGGKKNKQYLEGLKQELFKHNIPSFIVGEKASIDQFYKQGFVTISNIYRAKGNEAWKVYACRFHYATQPLEYKQETELHKRNEALVALTRSRVWCVVTGLKSPIFEELEQAKKQFPYLNFPAFNSKLLQRVTDNNEE